MRCGRMRCGDIWRCGKGKYISVEGIEISESGIVINNGDTFQLSARVLPHNASNQKIIRTSSNESVATVENGLVTGLNSPGDAVITATSEEGGYTATCEVIVNPIK